MIPFLMKMVAATVGEAVVNKMRKEPVLVPYDAKGLVKSKTAWGVVLMGLGPVVGGWLGWDSMDWGALAEQLTVAVGAVVAIYGRIKASGPIG